MESCCAIEYYCQKDCGEREKEGEMLAMERNQQIVQDENFGNSCIGKTRKFLWNVTEYPEKSSAGRVMSLFCLCYTFTIKELLMVLIISTFIFTLILSLFLCIGIGVSFIIHGFNIDYNVCLGDISRASRERGVSFNVSPSRNH